MSKMLHAKCEHANRLTWLLFADCSCLQEASDFRVDEDRCFNHSVAAVAVTSTAEIAVVVADFHSIVTGGVWLVQGTGRVETAPKIAEAMLAA